MGTILDAAHRMKKMLGLSSPPLRCSACDHPRSDAVPIICGPGVYLCGSCIGTATERAPETVRPTGPVPRCQFCDGARPLVSFANGAALRACTVCMQMMRDMIVEHVQQQ